MNNYKTKYFKILTRDFLIKEYIKNKKSSIEIAKKIGCVKGTILNYFKKFNIPIKTNSEAHIGLQVGKNNGMYGKKHSKATKLKMRRNHLHIKGKNHGRYIDGRASKIYYCKEKGCNNEISYWNWLYGQGRCHSCTMKKRWKNKNYRKKQLKKLLINSKPNKPEKQLNKLLKKTLPKQYNFVGNGKLIVSGFCPDFVNKDNNKIIELYGDYWHTKKGIKERDIRRIKTYEGSGYKVLIIWQHELKDLKKVKTRILKFNFK